MTITCAAACTVTLTITIPSGEAASTHKGKGKGKALAIAKGKFTIHKHGAQKFTLHLTSKGKTLLRRHHGKLTASLLAIEKVNGLKPQTTTRTIKIKPGKKG